MQVPPSQVRFHTTQYDLNMKFLRDRNFVERSFHTTQYDLNLLLLIFLLAGKFCFHTTQYDLNTSLRLRRPSVVRQFPYYIVRFKQGYFRTSTEGLGKFPYYIVRFKRSIYESANPLLRLFPYYIVRFKQACPHRLCIPFFRFHTTQYDLNLARALLLLVFGGIVSILHSTI